MTRYISGGSSSGSAVAVAKGLCAFSLGTDTAGSGRVPAAFNNLVGLKPTRGLLSTAGVVPACRSLDCVSIFTATAADAARGVARRAGLRSARPVLAHRHRLGPVLHRGSPAPSDLACRRAPTSRFSATLRHERCIEQAVKRLEDLGGTKVAIDFTPFREAAALLYSGPWVAERFAAVGEFLWTPPRGGTGPHGINEVVATIITSGTKYSAVDAYRAAYRLEELKRDAAAQWAGMDVLLLPTAGTIYTKEAVEADPIQLNSNLGYYTNFVNLMDLAAIAVPAGFRLDGLPFGVSLVARAFTDLALIALGERFLNESPAQGIPGCVALAVVGAHLRGQPLNYQLTDRGARFVTARLTAADYKLFALADTVPPKPGLARENAYEGPGIEVEVWAVPEDHFGGFVAMVPPPLAIGSVRLDSGEWVKGFVCEPIALSGAIDITRFGGWRKYLQSRIERSED